MFPLHRTCGGGDRDGGGQRRWVIWALSHPEVSTASAARGATTARFLLTSMKFLPPPASRHVLVPGAASWRRLLSWVLRVRPRSEEMTLKTVTGIKPTGAAHLGIYLGTIRPALALAGRSEALCFIADYHALTTVRDPDSVGRLTRDVAATWLALGVDPHRTALYRQSDLPGGARAGVATGVLDREGALEPGPPLQGGRGRPPVPECRPRRRGERPAVLPPGAHGRRHPHPPSRRRPGRRRPDPAPRDYSRRRDARVARYLAPPWCRSRAGRRA